MVAAGYDRKLVCDALSIDKTVISRMLAVVEALPDRLIRAIGAAPSAGRDRWLSLAQKAQERPVGDLVPLAVGPDSDARFTTVLSALTSPLPDLPRSPWPAPTVLRWDSPGAAKRKR